MNGIAKSLDAAIVKRLLQVTSEAPSGVYRPSDDTFLMLDAICDYPFNGKNALDVGTGSGILGLFAAIQGAAVTVADIDELALRHVTRAARSLGVRVNAIVSDLFARVDGQFDVVLFNPPYLPSLVPVDVTVDGGWRGVAVIESFLHELAVHLKMNGTAFLLVSSLNGPSALMEKHREFSYEVQKRRTLFFEELLVLRLRLRDFSQ